MLNLIVNLRSISGKILLLTIILTFQNCKNDKTDRIQERREQYKARTNKPVNLQTGTIINNVACKANKGQSYALYLPGNYVAARKWPIIYFFDPHARGNLPLKTYSNLAEKYGYILAGSNNSQNGLPWNTINNISATLFDDTQQRLSINKSRIYVAGFSGGARIASTLAINNNDINGIACCGGGFSEIRQSSEKNFSFIGFVGNEDFNYLEMKKSDSELDRIGIRKQLIEFEGLHAWPKAETFEDAFLWFEFNAFKDNLIPVNDTLISNYKKNLISKIDSIQKQGDQLQLVRLYEKLINYLNGIIDVTEYSTHINKLKNSSRYKNALDNEVGIMNTEVQFQQYYLNLFSSNDLNKLEIEILNLKSKIQQGNKPDEILMLKRIINFMSMITYSYTNNSLSSGNIQKAEEFLKIYGMLTPEVPEYHYLSACYFSRTNEVDKALKALEEAINHGFNDKIKLQNDKMLESIRNQRKFQELVKQIETLHPN